MLPQAQLDRLKRFDRRLEVEPEPARLGTYRVVYRDGAGSAATVLRHVRELGRAEFGKLYEAAPWKRGLTLLEAVEAADGLNEELLAAERPDIDAIGGEAWDYWQHIKRRSA